jgi:hypothetical protein
MTGNLVLHCTNRKIVIESFDGFNLIPRQLFFVEICTRESFIHFTLLSILSPGSVQS